MVNADGGERKRKPSVRPMHVDIQLCISLGRERLKKTTNGREEEGDREQTLSRVLRCFKNRKG